VESSARREDILEIFEEAQQRGREWLTGVRVSKPSRATTVGTDRKASIVRHVLRGADCADVARAHHVSVHAVYKLLQRLKIPHTRKPHPGWRRGVNKLAADALLRGETRKAVEEKYGLTRKQVRDLASRVGVLVCPRPAPGRDVKILREIVEGRKTPEVARRNDLSYNGVVKIAHKYGVELGRKARARTKGTWAPPAHVPEKVQRMIKGT
jgi:DNA-binding CsgD family transcriptional regulator